MRFELAGSYIRLDPLVLRFDADQDLDVLKYTDLGYRNFDVICIGGGGGRGGGIDTENSGTFVKAYGGSGGGGGFHRVRGLLSALPDLCPVVVGQAGAQGTSHRDNPALTTNGGNGEASTFNDDACRASGGEGGKRVQSNSVTVSTQANGGEGGAADRTLFGGGAAGGLAGTPSATGPGTAGTAGSDGTFAYDRGQGGGGGAGGVGKYGGITCNPATAGGRGSYNPGDISVYGPGTLPDDDLTINALDIIPGKAGGAKASPLNGLSTVFGLSGEPGIVIVRLTTE